MKILIEFIIEFENKNFKEKTSNLNFYIKTNDSEEAKVKILIDSGSDFNCIHPEFARVNNIKFIKAENPFKVVGFGYGLSTVKRLLKSVYSVSRIILRSSNYIPSVFLMSISFYDSLRSKSIVQ